MATPKHCLVPTEEINDFIKKNYPDKSHYLVLCQIALWQEAHADNWDQLPSKEELDAYVKMLRGKHSEIKTPLKQEFKGKLVFAESGTGKSTIADNIDVLDGDAILAELLGVPTPLAASAMTLLDGEQKKMISDQYVEKMLSLVKEGKTVITANPRMLEHADYIFYNSSPELTMERTGGDTRTNPYTNKQYAEETGRKIREFLRTETGKKKQHRSLGKSEYLSSYMLEDKNFKVYAKRVQESGGMLEVLQSFLDNFGFSLQEYNEEGPSIDLLERIVRGSNEKEIVEAAGKAIAFMMQYSEQEKGLIMDMAKDLGIIEGETRDKKGNVLNEKFKEVQKNKENFDKILGTIGKVISEEYARQYDFVRQNGKLDTRKPKNSFLQKVLDIVLEFFNRIFNNSNLTSELFSLSRYVASNILQNNPSMIMKSIRKPGDEDAGPVSRVDIVGALDENPFERNIILELGKEGIALAGSSSMALTGSVFRPAENPLHDIDFSAPGKNKEELETILERRIGKCHHIRTIDNEDGRTETFLYVKGHETTILPAGQKEFDGVINNKDTYNIYDKDTNELLGVFKGSSLTMQEGYSGKFLDFFAKEQPFDNLVIDYNGQKLVIQNDRGALYSKVDWKRIKDLFDYNRFKRDDYVEGMQLEGNVRQEYVPYMLRRPTFEDISKAAYEFNPLERNFRVNMLTNMFSDYLDQLMDIKREEISNELQKASSNEEKDRLFNQLINLERTNLLKETPPKQIYMDIYEELKEEYEEAETEHERKAFLKILSNYNVLVQESARMLAIKEGILVKVDGTYGKRMDMREEDLFNEARQDDIDDGTLKEYADKEGWMVDFQKVSSFTSLTQKVRRAIGRIPMKSDVSYETMENGKRVVRYKPLRDDLKYTMYLPAVQIHNILLAHLSNMTSSEDMDRLLDSLALKYGWVQDIKDMLANDSQLRSQFYMTYRKDFVNYWNQRWVRDKNGNVSVRFNDLNKPVTTFYLFDKWKSNYYNRIRLTGDSVYDINGNLVKENAEKLISRATALKNKFSRQTYDKRFPDDDAPMGYEAIQGINKLLTDDDVKEFTYLLNSIGCDGFTAEELKDALLSTKEKQYETNMNKVANVIETILTNISKGKKSYHKDNKEDTRGVLFTQYVGTYKAIANYLGIIGKDAVLDSIHENGASRYSYVTPGYLMKLIKQLKNSRELSEEEFKAWMDKEFKQYKFFYDPVKQKWNNKLLEDIYTNAGGIRNELRHKAVVHFERKEYKDLTESEYQQALLYEFFIGDTEEGTDLNYGWFMIPQYADNNSAEFLRLKIIDDNEEGGSFKDIIAERMIDLVMQEYNRIQDVRKRHELRMSYANTGGREGKNIPVKQNYDITYDKDGKLVPGGSEFKFLSGLNNMDAIGKDGEWKSFIEALEEYVIDAKENNSDTELRLFVKKELGVLLDVEFESFKKHFAQLGLMQEDKNGKNTKFPFLSGMNKHLEEYKEIVGKLYPLNREKYDSQLISEIDMINQKLMNKEYVSWKELHHLLEKAVEHADENQREDIYGYMDELEEGGHRDPYDGKLALYFYNSAYYTSQIIQTTTTDLAYYKDVIDFVKRFKQMHSPMLRLDTEATFDGERVGKKTERVLYLKDKFVQSRIVEEVKSVLRSVMSEKEAEIVASKYLSNNLVDAQALRSAKSYREVMIMAGRWDARKERAWNRIRQGNYTVEDMFNVFQVVKPFMFTNSSEDDGLGGKMRVSVQNKNSELPLVAMMQLIGGPFSKSPMLRALSRFMEEHDIDMVEFESAVKVGASSVLDTEQLEGLSEDGMVDKLEELTGFKDDRYNRQGNPDVIHEYSYEDYGIQMETPEHMVDERALFGIQLKKLIMADMSSQLPYLFTGKDGKKIEMSNVQVEKLYNALQVENLIPKYLELVKKFSDPQKVMDMIRREVEGSTRYGLDILRAMQADKDGNISIPLGDPAIRRTTEAILTSIIRKALTRTYVKGGAAYQVSAFGMSEGLSIVFKDAEGNEMTYESWRKEHEKGTREEYNDYVKGEIAKGGLSIAYYECYMPAYSKEFYKHCLTRKKDRVYNYKTGRYEEKEYEYLDVSKLPDELRNVVGYRIPTEDKYSMMPLRIKEFTSPQMGNIIVMPAEITTITGSDFDIDKIYFMFYEFATREVMDWKGLIKEFRKSEYGEKYKDKDYDDFLIARDQIINNQPFSEDTFDMDFYDFYVENREKYLKTKIGKVKYDYGKQPEENTMLARNNALVDIIWSILTNPSTAARMLTPQSSDMQKKAGLMIQLIRNGVEKFKLDMIDRYSVSEMKKMLNEALESSGKDGILSPVTWTTMQNTNMTGKNMIPPYANHNTHHALIMMNRDITGHPSLITEENRFSFYGENFNDLSVGVNVNGVRVTRVLAGFIGASVDNAKDPILGYLNQNWFTVDVSMLMARLGYDVNDIAIIMNTPVVKEMSEIYNTSKNKDKTAAAREVISKYVRMVGRESMPDEHYRTNRGILASVIYHSSQGMPLNTEEKIAMLHTAIQFTKALRIADKLAKKIRVSKPDGSNNMCGPTIVDMFNRMYDVYKAEEGDDLVLTNADLVVSYSPLDWAVADGVTDRDKLREAALKSSVSMMQSITSLAYEGAVNMLSDYFVQASPNFWNLYNYMRSISISGKLDSETLNRIANMYIAYRMSALGFFGDETVRNEDGSVTTKHAWEKRREFLNDFPAKAMAFLNTHPSVANLPFFKQFRLEKDDTFFITYLDMYNGGRIVPEQREIFMMDWEGLLYDDDKEVRDFAMDLVKYSFFRYGLSFGNGSFFHLASVLVRNEIPGYFDKLRDMLHEEQQITIDEEGNAYNPFHEFAIQFIRNCPNDFRFVKNAPDKVQGALIKDGIYQEEVEFTDENDAFNEMISERVRMEDGSYMNVYHTFWGVNTSAGPRVYMIEDAEGQGGMVHKAVLLKRLGKRGRFYEFGMGEGVDMPSQIRMQSRKSGLPKFEISTKARELKPEEGDARFLALNATFKPGTRLGDILGEDLANKSGFKGGANYDVGGVTIETIYQQLKKSGKGQAPAEGSILFIPENKRMYMSQQDMEDFSYNTAYLPLWRTWAEQNSELIQELHEKTKGMELYDSKANTSVNNARALTDIMEEMFPAEEGDAGSEPATLSTQETAKEDENDNTPQEDGQWRDLLSALAGGIPSAPANSDAFRITDSKTEYEQGNTPICK